MRVKFLRDTAIGGEHFAAGNVAEISDASARIVCAIRKAEPCDAPVIDTSGDLNTSAAEGLIPEVRKAPRKAKS